MLDRPRIAEQTVAVSFAVNGEAVTVVAEPFASLASTLRDDLGLTGTKIGCDAGDCGACTVLMDGEQVCACLVATAQAEGASIETVEGHGPGGLTDRLREAFLAHGAAQCGICTPGMLMAAVDCLHTYGAARPRGDGGCARRRALPLHGIREDRRGGDGCGGARANPLPLRGEWSRSDRVRDARPRAASRPPLIRLSPCNGGEGRCAAVGARLPRADGRAKVDGTDLFGADFAPADALWMRVVRSPHARATFTLGDLDAVIAETPGLVAILTAEDVPGKFLRHFRASPRPAGARAGTCAVSRRGGAGAGRDARSGGERVGRRSADRVDASSNRSPASTRPLRPGRSPSTRTRPTTC